MLIFIGYILILLPHLYPAFPPSMPMWKNHVSNYLGFLADYLEVRKNPRFKYTVNLLLFLVVAELEYGFSNLWLLTDKPQFWPALTDRCNQLFVQMLWAPFVKVTGYLLTTTVIDCYTSAPCQKEEDNKAKAAATTTKETLNWKPALFNSLKEMKATVFSQKVKRIPRLFSQQFFSAPLEAANDNCNNPLACSFSSHRENIESHILKSK